MSLRGRFSPEAISTNLAQMPQAEGARGSGSNQYEVRLYDVTEAPVSCIKEEDLKTKLGYRPCPQNIRYPNL
jgi:hypothetical protein